MFAIFENIQIFLMCLIMVTYDLKVNITNFIDEAWKLSNQN